MQLRPFNVGRTICGSNGHRPARVDDRWQEEARFLTRAVSSTSG
jgi:hypothetical protein